MGSAAEPHNGPAPPQGEFSADTEISPGAAPSEGTAAASRGGQPIPEGLPITTGAALAAAGPRAAAAPPPAPRDASPAGGDVPLDGFAPESLGTLAAEPPALTELQRREEAFNAAWRFLSRRERTEAEVRARLERNDVEAPLIDEVLDQLQQDGYVDDAGYAQRFAEDRRNLDSWGADRIERRLRELGVPRQHIAAALAAGDHDELVTATALLARRYPIPPDTPRDLEKALGFLVRKGFDLELAHDALRRHAAAAVER